MMKDQEPGSKNDAAEKKPDLSLLPLDLLGEVARAYEYGLIKYQRNNWRKCFQTHRSIAAALRHISKWNDEGEEYDKEALENANMQVHHIGMAIFNLLCVLQTIKEKPELVDKYFNLPPVHTPQIIEEGTPAEILGKDKSIDRKSFILGVLSEKAVEKAKTPQEKTKELLASERRRKQMISDSCRAEESRGVDECEKHTEDVRGKEKLGGTLDEFGFHPHPKESKVPDYFDEVKKIVAPANDEQNVKEYKASQLLKRPEDRDVVGQVVFVLDSQTLIISNGDNIEELEKFAHEYRLKHEGM